MLREYARLAAICAGPWWVVLGEALRRQAPPKQVEYGRLAWFTAGARRAKLKGK